MRIAWTNSAQRDLAAHFDYLAARNPDSALQLEATTMQIVEGLIAFPHRGRPGRREGTRELLVPHLPYIVIYSIREERIIVLRILHTAQDWPPRES